jgi:hypothetical protein
LFEDLATYFLPSFTMRILLLLFLLNGSLTHAQDWFSDYLPLVEGNEVSYDEYTINDTIWLHKDDSNHLEPIRKDYRFKFIVKKGGPILFDYSRRIGGADPDYNCLFSKHSALRDSGEVVICFPGRMRTPPYIHTRRYIANSNTNKRDTLTVNRIFRWADRDTICTNIPLGDTIVTLVQHLASPKPTIIYLNIHENEATSIEALKKVADSVDISYYYLQHRGTRRIFFSNEDEEFSIDPNRIYTKMGRDSTLADETIVDSFALAKTTYLAQRLLWKFQAGKAIVSVHNNTPDEYSILSYLPEGGEEENTGKLYINENMDPDDFIYTTDSLVFEAAKNDSINVVLQSTDNFVDDGSLSIYCGKENLPYVNVETEHEHLDEQVRLLYWIREILEKRINAED